MANVKITDLTELAAIDVATNDVLPIVDVNNDSTKKVTISSLTTSVAAANDYATYVQLNANIDAVQSNVSALSSVLRISNTGTTDDVTVGTDDLVFAGSGGLTPIITDNSVTFQLDDTAVTAGLYGGVEGTTTNVAVITVDAQGRITAASNATVAVDLATLESNVNTVQSNVAALETRRADNTFFTYNSTGDQANVIVNGANVEPSQNNIFSLGAPDKVWKELYVGPGSIKLGNVTLSAVETGLKIEDAAGDTTQIDTSVANVTANLNLIQDNVNAVSQDVSALETRRDDNVTIRINAFTGTNAAIVAAESRLNSNLDVTNDNVTTLTTTVDNFGTSSNSNAAALASEDAALQSRLSTNVTALTNEDTALQSRLSTNVTAFTNEDTALQVRIDDNAAVAASNDFITFTRLNANVDIVQDNVATNATDITALETRRTNNIAGAVSTITTSDLTASRAVVSDGSGKVAVSAVTSTELGHLDGVTSAIQTQLDAVEARRAANLVSATFTGEVSMSDDLIVTGNLTVNGDTTTVNSENKVIQDRFIMLANSVSGAPSADVGILFNRGTSGNAALFYDESAKFFTLSETRDPDTNVAISPTGAANLSVGQFTASSVSFDGADLSTAITDNVATLNTSITAVETRRTNNIAGAISTVLTSDLTASRALIAGTGGKIEVSDVTSTELGHLDGVTSAIQTQLDAKQATITGAATTIDDTNLTASRALVSSGSGKVAVSAVTSTELGRLDGVTSSIQTQLDAKLESVGTSDINDNAVTVGKLAATLDLGALS